MKNLTIWILLTLGLTSCGESLKFPWEKEEPADKISRLHQEKILKEVGNGDVSEVGKAAADAIREKEEKKLVARAGEGAVALQLARKQYAELKERLVRIKTLRQGFERDLKSSQAKSEESLKAGKADIAEMYSKKSEMRRQMISVMSEREPQAEKALQDYAIEYEKLKVEVELLQDEIAMHNAATGILDSKGPDNPLKKRLDHIDELKKELGRCADRAKSLYDVSQIEEKFSL